MLVSDSFELFTKLSALELLAKSPKLWWPNYGTFEVVVGAILTQNSRFDKVQISLENLRRSKLDQLESWHNLESSLIMPLIKPSGLYRQKSMRLLDLTQAIMDTYGDFDLFVRDTDRDWLLAQKGIGPESADAILCYACKREVMVVDSYTGRLLKALGYEFETYYEIQDWLITGMETQGEHLENIYGKDTDWATVYAHFHGMIVEYCKLYCKGNKTDVSLLV